MLKYISISTLFVLCSYLHCLAQNKGDYVRISSSNTLPSPGSEGTIIDFNDGRDTISLQLAARIDIANTSICTSDGDLLLYTNGCSIFDSTYNVIDNGDGINPGQILDSWCDTGSYPEALKLFIQ